MDENHPWRKDLETIVQQTSRCRNIVKGLLDFARQRKPDKKQWDIHTLIERTISLVEQQAPFQNIRIVKEFKTDLPMLYVDGDQIQQVFMNIILNAGDAMARKGGTLTIKTEARDGIAEVSFTDTGPGISKEHLQNSSIPSSQRRRPEREQAWGLPSVMALFRVIMAISRWKAKREKGQPSG